MMEWRQIAEFDQMKVKPALAVFYFEAKPATHWNHAAALPATVQMSRVYGGRLCTKFIVLPTP